MGEYFYIANLDKQEFIDPSDFGAPIKLGGLMRTQFSGVLPYLLCKSRNTDKRTEYYYYGRWESDSIAFVGDTSPLYRTITSSDSYEKIGELLAVEYNYFAREQLIEY